MGAGRDWLSGLEPDHPCDLASSACAPATVYDAVARIGAGPVCWAIEQGRGAAERITAGVPLFDGGDVASEVLRRGSEAATLQSLMRLAEPQADLPPVGAESLDGVGEFVQRAIPLDQVLRAIRIGHAELARSLLLACERLVEPARVAVEMKAVNDELFGHVDAFTDGMTRRYLAEHDRWISSAAAMRVTTVQALLAQRSTEADARAASRTLGYDLARTHVGVIAWADTPLGSTRLESVTTDLLRSWGAPATLLVPVGSGKVWAWGTVPRRGLGTGSVPDLGSGVYAVAGEPGPGLAGFRRTHQEALQVERLCGLAVGPPSPVTSYQDVALTVLLTGDLEAAGEFVRRELGQLSGSGAALKDLRATLLRYLEAERSLVSVAAQLHVARGTVAYRVKRAKEILGHEITDRRFPLYAALLLSEQLGDAVLEPGDPAV